MWAVNPNAVVTADRKADALRQSTRELFEEAIQSLVDEKPRERQFRDGVTLASYAASTNPAWASQAQAFIAWRDQVWAHAYVELAKVLAGQRDIPEVADFLAELPAIEWPY
ncbi:hypothetical protein [Shinella sp.]|uniref:hypothetical protein n=1 Tax=Shinella sp. TaxID=1870904 RepID=UPI0028A945C6|nr:hypothetical protein [Shinella sp.]